MPGLSFGTPRTPRPHPALVEGSATTHAGSTVGVAADLPFGLPDRRGACYLCAHHVLVGSDGEKGECRRYPAPLRVERQHFCGEFRPAAAGPLWREACKVV